MRRGAGRGVRRAKVEVIVWFLTPWLMESEARSPCRSAGHPAPGIPVVSLRSTNGG